MSQPPVDPNKRLKPNTYHPDLQIAVDAAYAQGVELLVFPALLRGDKVGDVVQYLTDATTVRKKPCSPCRRGGHACILHNASSLRCLNCYVGDAKECSHQTGTFTQFANVVCTYFAAEMERLGHAKAPPCMRYEVAEELHLIPVPEGYVWGGKDRNRHLLRTLRRPADDIQSAATGASQAAESDAEVTDSSDDDSKSRAEELDDSDDAGPPALSQKKTHIGRRSAPQGAEHSGQGRKRSLAEVLDTRLSDIHETLQHLLEAQQASLAIKKKRFEYLLSDDDVSSEEGSDMPLNLKKRTCTFCHDRRGLLTS